MIGTSTKWIKSLTQEYGNGHTIIPIVVHVARERLFFLVAELAHGQVLVNDVGGLHNPTVRAKHTGLPGDSGVEIHWGKVAAERSARPSMAI